MNFGFRPSLIWYKTETTRVGPNLGQGVAQTNASPYFVAFLEAPGDSLSSSISASIWVTSSAEMSPLRFGGFQPLLAAHSIELHHHCTANLDHIELLDDDCLGLPILVCV